MWKRGMAFTFREQLPQPEGDGIVARIVHAQVPPKVVYHPTP